MLPSLASTGTPPPSVLRQELLPDPSQALSPAYPPPAPIQDEEPISDVLRSALSRFLMQLWVNEQQYRYKSLIKLKRLQAQWDGYFVAPFLDERGGVFTAPMRVEPVDTPTGVQYHFNLFRSGGAKLIGALGLPPNTTVIPSVESNEEFQSRAQSIIAIDQMLGNAWNMTELVPEIVQRLYVSGNAFLYTPEANDDSWTYQVHTPQYAEGTTPDGFMALCHTCKRTMPLDIGVDQCPNCGSPYLERQSYTYPIVQTGVNTTDIKRYSVDRILRSGLNTFTAAEVPDWRSVRWLCDEQETHFSSIIARHHELRDRKIRDKYKFGQDEIYATYGRLARALRTGYTTDENVYWRESRWWLYPEYYYGIEDTAQGQRNKRGETVIDELNRLAPDGAKVTCFNGRACKIHNERLHDTWHGIKSIPGERFMSPPLGQQHAEGNMLMNDMLAIEVQTANSGVPITLIDSELVSPKTLAKRKAYPWSFLPFLNSADGRGVRDRVHTIDGAQLHPAVPQVLDQAVNMAQEGDSITRPLWGAGEVQQTFGATELVRSASLQPHNTTWNAVRDLVANGKQNGIKMLLKQAVREQTRELLFFTKPGQFVTMDMDADPEELLKGGWVVYCDPNFPSTPSQQKAVMWEALGMGELGVQLFDLMNPRNAEMFQKMLGLSGLQVKNLAAYRKAILVIRKLIELPPGQGIPADPNDDHELMIRIARDWLDENFKKFDWDGNGTGWPLEQKANVDLWMQEHANMLPPPMPMGPDGGPPQGGGGAPPPPPNGNGGGPPSPDSMGPGEPPTPEMTATSEMQLETGAQNPGGVPSPPPMY